MVHILPRQLKAKPALWAFTVVSIVPYIASDLAINKAQSSIIPSEVHPVETLIHNANTHFEYLLRQQSQTYLDAHKEYRRRYGAEPPPGFEAWYEFAKSQQSPIIDDFDMIYNAVSPFWRLSGNDVIDTMNHVQKAQDSELWLCELFGAQAKTHCSHPYRAFDRHAQLSLDTLLKELRGVLPNAKFLVNHLDEPRVLIPPQSVRKDDHGDGRFALTNISRQPVWKTLTKYCSLQGSRDAESKNATETFGLPFVIDPSSDMDLCQHPEYNATHGLAISPTSFRLIEGVVPILSTGSLSTMSDILYPSPAYIEAEFQYLDKHDVEWDSKKNNLYWAGSTTGGFAVDTKWRHYHRQRFVALAQNQGGWQHKYLREIGGTISRVKSSFLNRRLLDVAFTQMIQCQREQCRDQRAYFRVKPWADKNRALRSRFVFDLDGNGISGRYYKLLASKSVPLKQTLLREWHDERLVAWVHYIPVSQSMEELPEMISYLTSTEYGQKRAREIAEQGRDWFSKAFREVDRTIYMYRLLLELARLQDPNRPAV